MSKIITLTINKRGRKYFDCSLGKYSAKLVINAISETLEAGQTVCFSVKDLSESNKYGTVLKYEPLAILSDDDIEALREEAEDKKEAEKWLGYAESDVLKGMDRTSAIYQANERCKKYAGFTTRLEKMNALAQKNAAENQQSKTEKTVKSRRIFPLDEAPSVGTLFKIGDQVYVIESHGKAFQISEDQASIHGGRLSGREGDMACYCYYREATDTEKAAFKKDEAETISAEEKEAAKEKRFFEVKNAIISAGEIPEGMHQVEGEVLVNSMTAYGTGSCFVITDAHIWYIQNNGMDGDAWERNNVRTSGAGAIGWRVTFSQELADKIKKIDDPL